MSRFARASALAGCLALIVAAAPRAPSAHDWPRFRGPGGAGTAATAVPLSFDLESGDNVAWRVSLPGLAHSSPIVVGGRVYVTTAVAVAEAGLRLGDVEVAGIATDDDAELEHSWRLLAFALESGELLWQTEAHRGTPRVKRHVKASHASATPAATADRIVALFASEGMFGFDAAGRLLWHVDLGLMDPGLWGEPEVQWAPASSPVIHDGRVYVQNDRQAGSFVAAYDLETGAEIWRRERDEKPAWSTPVLVPGERPQLVLNGANALRGYDPADGAELWSLPRGEGEVITPSPLVVDDLAVLTGGYPPGANPIFALDVRAVDAGAPAVRWQVQPGSPYTPTPLAYQGVLYAVQDNGVLSAYDLETGDRLYRTRLEVGAGFSASPVAAAGTLYLASEDGDLFAVRAGREFELLARSDAAEPLLATPALAGDTLLLRGRTALLAIRADPSRTDAR